MSIISDEIFEKNDIEFYHNEFKNNQPYPYIIIDNFLEKNIADKLVENFVLNENWTNCSLVNNYKKYQLTNRTFMNDDCNKVFNELSSNTFIKQLEKITNINNLFLDKSLEGGGLHQIFDKGSLNVHTDFNSHTLNKSWRRVLNILIYLNKDWKDEYNGNLELWDENITHKVKSIKPIFNRCVIFKTDKKSFHGHPEKLNLPSGVSRKSIAGYYFVDEKKDLKLYSTYFVGRPKDTVIYKLLIWTDTFLNRIFSFLKRHKILNDKFASKVLDFFK